MKALFLTLALFCSVNFVHAQGNKTAAEASQKLQNQYDNLKSGANSYQEKGKYYKVIETRDLDSFWGSVRQTLQVQEKSYQRAGKAVLDSLVLAQEEIKNQAAEIVALKKDNALKDQAVQQNEYEVANISVFGLGVNKQVFIIFSFGTILILLAFIAVISAMYKNSKKVTEEKIKAFQVVDHEFNEYKKVAREREIKVKRELQTEINSKEELVQELNAMRAKSHA